jgi:hypothetical protein
MTFSLFKNRPQESYLDVADKLDELARSISRLPQVDPDLIARFRSFGARLRAEQHMSPPQTTGVDFTI